MNTARLAAHQKRLIFWENYAKEVQHAGLAAEMQRLLQEYRRTLAECWKTQGSGEAALARLSAYERSLTQLNEEARLAARPKG